jgi:hypothetical protein
MTPHSQVRDVNAVEDHVFHAASEVMPIGEVLLRGSYQTSDKHLQQEWGK